MVGQSVLQAGRWSNILSVLYFYYPYTYIFGIFTGQKFFMILLKITMSWFDSFDCLRGSATIYICLDWRIWNHSLLNCAKIWWILSTLVKCREFLLWLENSVCLVNTNYKTANLIFFSLI